jgi:hypothetical protein
MRLSRSSVNGTPPVHHDMTALDDLAAERRWVAWRYETRGPEGKPTKIPYGRGGKPAKADDSATWLTRAEAEALAAKIVNGHGGGTGLELGDVGFDQHIIGFDLDSCISREDGSNLIAPWAQRLIEAIPSYGEISPSGNGIKLLAYAATEDVRPFLDAIGVQPDQWGCRRTAPGLNGADHGPAIEVYCAARYFAITEQRLSWAPARLVELDRETLQRIAALIPPPRSAGPNKNGVGPFGKSSGDDSRSAKAFRKGLRLRREGKSFEEMLDALRNDPETADWVRDKGMAFGMRELRRIWERAAPNPSENSEGGVSLDDFYAYMPSHSYLFVPSGEMWPATSINARIPPLALPALGEDGKPVKLSASKWLDTNRPVEQMTWAPGEPLLIADRLVSHGGWIERDGVSCLNLYRPPIIRRGSASMAGPWIELVHWVYPDDGGHLEAYLAHRVQRPAEKINHGLVMGGAQGIGKDTILEPVKHAVGPWNFQEVSPQQLLGRFNGFVKSVILRISEARDLGDINRYQFYDHIKGYTAAPPDVIRVDEKHLREYSVMNCCGVIITSNHKTDGLFLPADDRRHYVAWSDRTKEERTDDYWIELYRWYEHGGNQHVAAYLATLDISRFNPKAPPQKTQAFWEIVDASRAPEDAELADALDLLGKPDIVTVSDVITRTTESFANWLQDRKNSRRISHRFEECGYVAVRNEHRKTGVWAIRGKRQVIYAKASLSPRERLAAAQQATGAR